MIPTAFIALAVVTLVFPSSNAFTSGPTSLTMEPQPAPALRNPNHSAPPHLRDRRQLVLPYLISHAYERHPVSIGSSIHIAVSPQWSWFFSSYFILALANATLAAANLMRPYSTRSAPPSASSSDATGAIIFCWLLKAQPPRRHRHRHRPLRQVATHHPGHQPRMPTSSPWPSPSPCSLLTSTSTASSLQPSTDPPTA